MSILSFLDKNSSRNRVNLEKIILINGPSIFIRVKLEIVLLNINSKDEKAPWLHPDFISSNSLNNKR